MALWARPAAIWQALSCIFWQAGFFALMSVISKRLRPRCYDFHSFARMVECGRSAEQALCHIGGRAGFVYCGAVHLLELARHGLAGGVCRFSCGVCLLGCLIRV